MKVIFYKKDNGKEPVMENIFELEKNEKVKILKVLDDIREKGFKATGCEFRQIDGELWEIKIRLSKGGYRIFYVIANIDIMILLHSYRKQSQKAPQKELNIAFKRMKDFINNKEWYEYDRNK